MKPTIKRNHYRKMLHNPAYQEKNTVHRILELENSLESV